MSKFPLAGVVSILVAVPLGYFLAGRLGAVVVGVAVWIAALLVLSSRIPTGFGRARRTRAGVAFTDAEFPSYRRLLSLVGWAQRSPRHYDYAVRPTFQALAAARLAQRRGIDLYTEPAKAAELLGDGWTLVDPTRPPSQQSAPPGVALGRIDDLVRKLETL